ncbi:hypothetical protein [Methylocapsa palsarum]|uniref:Uncharacterized protein n=1 Tax=Methylocapsa palsarum TaxID=1612308 RepID=A0A1I4CJ89_9HYPH|nr:hypothetical protein [Methylocapsa palsarum]SFK80126.1 hypothetical protein SAMN05444581_12214 [Methylocapsa palsarum]
MDLNITKGGRSGPPPRNSPAAAVDLKLEAAIASLGAAIADSSENGLRRVAAFCNQDQGQAALAGIISQLSDPHAVSLATKLFESQGCNRNPTLVLLRSDQPAPQTAAGAHIYNLGRRVLLKRMFSEERLEALRRACASLPPARTGSGA